MGSQTKFGKSVLCFSYDFHYLYIIIFSDLTFSNKKKIQTYVLLIGHKGKLKVGFKEGAQNKNLQ